MEDHRSVRDYEGYISTLSDIATQFLDWPIDETPGPVIAAGLAELCPGAYPLYSRIDAEERHLILEVFGNADAVTARVREALHIELPFEMPLDADRLSRLRSAEVLHLPNDISEICHGRVDPGQSTRISDESGIAEIAIVPYVQGDVCYGASPVICRHGVTLPPDSVLVAFGRLAASMLRRRSAEEALIANEKKYRALFTASSDAVLFLKAGEIIDANPKAVELFGAGTAEALIGLHPLHISPAHQPDETGGIGSHRLITRLLGEAEEGNLFPFEWAFRGLDGRFFDGEVMLSRVLIGDDVSLYAVIRDISGRKRSDAEIIASKERYRQLAESSFNAIVTCDTRGIITFASPSTGRVLGVSPAEITGTCFYALYAEPGDQEHARSMLESVLGGTVVNGHQFVFTGVNGQTLHLSINANRIHGNGGVTGAMAIIQDISDSYRAQEAEAEVQFRSYLFSAAFENNPLGMFLLHVAPEKSRIVDWNETMEDVSGLKKEDVVGTMMEGFSIDPGFLEVVHTLVAQTAATGQARTMHTTYREDAGDIRYLKLYSALIADPRGEGAYVMFIVRDETERVRYEREITESEERYRNMADAIGEPMLTIDAGLTVLLANRAFRMLYESRGFPGDIVGRSLPELSPALNAEETAAIRQVFEKGSLVKRSQHLDLGGVPIRAEVTLVPVFCRGVVEQVVILVRDITTEFDLELLKKEAFEQIERNMEQFAILNDHIRNPLQGILGICELEEMEQFPLVQRHVTEIDTLIRRLDIGYLESEKVRAFLRKHYGMLDA